MKQLTFKGGLHPHDHKEQTKNKPIERLEASKIMVFPLCQHIGSPSIPCVNVGDYVKRGQMIGESKTPLSLPVHSSVSGTVVGIEPRLATNGTKINSVIIENDFKYDTIEDIHYYDDYEKLSKDDMVEILKSTGIVGLGGAGFPSHIKLNPPDGKKIHTLIINGAECEPYLTSDYRIMLETPDDILKGAEIIRGLVGAQNIYIAIEDNKPEAIKVMSECAKNYENTKVVTLKTKYPQGSEKHLIYAIFKKEVPTRKIPADVGCVVDNVDTAIAVYKAITRRKPVLSRVVTVSGSAIGEPKNLRVQVGTSILDILTACNADFNKLKKVIAGGPMMGFSLSSLDIPTVKTTSAVLGFGAEELEDAQKNKTSCIRCAKCVFKCPMGLVPLQLSNYAKLKDYEMCRKLNIFDCIECGVCSYYCQADANPLQYIKVAKKQILELERKPK